MDKKEMIEIAQGMESIELMDELVEMGRKLNDTNYTELEKIEFLQIISTIEKELEARLKEITE